MSRIGAAWLILGLLLWGGCAHIPEDKEPAGFRGVTWGSSSGEVGGLKLVVEDGETRYYEREGDKLRIGNATLRSISYGFFQDRFYGVVVKYDGEENYYRLFTTLLDTYGEARRTHRFFKKWEWSGDRVKVILSYSEVTRDGALTFHYTPILVEKSGERDL
ncbi:MAG: hypothetical protein AB1896_14245 [Thermodesulfobacteriota bacterium]